MKRKKMIKALTRRKTSQRKSPIENARRPTSDRKQMNKENRS
jgi:hypothetical protein